MNEMVAVVEDEKDILDLLTLHLKKNGFRYRAFSTAESFLNSVDISNYNLILLDIMLPDMEGTEVCKKLKSNPLLSNVPVIMVTAKTGEADKIVGLELGADDYISKPFSPGEMIARIRAVLRRSSNKNEPDSLINIGEDIVIDSRKREVSVSGKKVELTFAEFGVLSILASHKGWVFTREKIIDTLWDGEKAVIERTVDVHVKNLRDKLGDAGRHIQNVRGVGYKIEE